MSYQNLPGTFPLFQDGNLQVSEPNNNPAVLILGTSPSGDADSTYSVASVSIAASVFGKTDGTLVRSLYEVIAGGARNVRLMRVGATSASLTKIGHASSTLTVTTAQKDYDAGINYKLFWNQAAGRLQVWRVSDQSLVYDNNPAYPSAAIDTNEVSVSGTANATGANVGSTTYAGAITLLAANAVSGSVFTTGTDGILLSRMELFEAFYKAYALLENEIVDIIVPANAYLDDLNVMDMTTTEVLALNIAPPWLASSAYPTPGSIYDILGKVFVQEYNGETYFWWDLDNDGAAEIFPATSVGSATATTDAFGVALTAGDFHEVNFGYQLADFCYRKSENDRVVHGMIGVNPPLSWSLKDVNNWVGRSPVVTTNTSGQSIITSNGTGLLGNKWKAGRLGSVVSGLPAFPIDGVDGLGGGGFVGTDSGWVDGGQLEDNNEHRIDIGKYLSVVGAQTILSNSTSLFSYAASGATVYAGFVSSLPENSAPTNKIQPGVRLPFRVSVGKLDALAGAGYVMFQQKPQGVVVSDAPTGARTDSDYRRLTTFRIIDATVQAIRAASEKFLGEPITGSRLAALETAINGALQKLQQGSYLQRYDAIVTSTPAQQVQGKATVELVCVPSFELRQITVMISLAAQ